MYVLALWNASREAQEHSLRLIHDMIVSGCTGWETKCGQMIYFSDYNITILLKRVNSLSSFRCILLELILTLKQVTLRIKEASERRVAACMRARVCVCVYWRDRVGERVCGCVVLCCTRAHAFGGSVGRLIIRLAGERQAERNRGRQDLGRERSDRHLCARFRWVLVHLRMTSVPADTLLVH